MSTPPLTHAAFITTGIRCASPEPSTECSICYEPLAQNVVRTIACNHSFHLACITQWTIGEGPTNNKCPLCRQTLFFAPGNELRRQSLISGGPYPYGVLASSEHGYMGAPTVGGPGSTGPRGYGLGHAYVHHYPGGYPVGHLHPLGYTASYYRHGPMVSRRSRSPEYRPDRFAGVSEPHGPHAEFEASRHPQAPTASRDHGIPSAQSLADRMAQRCTENRRTVMALSDEELRDYFQHLLDSRPTRSGRPSQDLPRDRDRERSPTHVEHAEHTIPSPIGSRWASSLRGALPPYQDPSTGFHPSRGLVNEIRSRPAANPTSHSRPRPGPRDRNEFPPQHDQTENRYRGVVFECRAAEYSESYAPAEYELSQARDSADNRWTPHLGDVSALSPDEIRRIRDERRFQRARFEYLQRMREAEED